MLPVVEFSIGSTPYSILPLPTASQTFLKLSKDFALVSFPKKSFIALSV